MARYKCPLCGTTLTRARYEEVLRIQQERDRAAQAQIEAAHRRVRDAKEAERQAKAALRRQAREAKVREQHARDTGRKQGRAESQDLQEHYTRVVTIARFGGDSQQTLLTMRSRALERAASEIDYAILEATRTRSEGENTANFAFYAPVGAVLSGPGSTATVHMSLGPAERETVVKALVAIEQAVGASAEVAPLDREQIAEVVTDLKDEIQKEKPNAVKLRGGLSALATTIQTMGSAKGAYELLKAGATLFGLHLP